VHVVVAILRTFRYQCMWHILHTAAQLGLSRTLSMRHAKHLSSVDTSILRGMFHQAGSLRLYACDWHVTAADIDCMFYDDVQWCHKSGYDGVSCAKARAAKRFLWNKCATKAVSNYQPAFCPPAGACFVWPDPVELQLVTCHNSRPPEPAYSTAAAC
jgi:hypothetical protein